MKTVEEYPLCWPSGRRRSVQNFRARFAEVPFGRARDTLLAEINRAYEEAIEELERIS